MLIPLLMLLAGFVILLKASSYTVKNSMLLSKQSGISELIIGFIFVAIGTSVPELSVAIVSSVNGQGSLSFGNLIGANISNLALIFGFMALFGFTIQKKRLMEINQAIIFTIVIAVFLIYLKRIDAAFGIFSIVLFYAFCKNVLREEREIEKRKHIRSRKKILTTSSYLILSIVLVIIGAELITKSAVDIAAMLGLQSTAIGATLLAAGTTIPEFTVAIMALKRKDINLAIGDSIGSVVTNITLVLGIAAIINPISVDASGSLALISMLVISGIFLFFATHLRLKKEQGVILILSYIIFLYIMLSGAFI